MPGSVAICRASSTRGDLPSNAGCASHTAACGDCGTRPFYSMPAEYISRSSKGIRQCKTVVKLMATAWSIKQPKRQVSTGKRLQTALPEEASCDETRIKAHKHHFTRYYLLACLDLGKYRCHLQFAPLQGTQVQPL